MTTELGEFLKIRRAAISPEEAGLVSYGARRVPGLRREEIAQLAGVSPTYYTRLEQSASHNASDGVIDSLARALSLNPQEHEHLRRLAHPEPGRVPRRPKPTVARPETVAMIMSMSNPAVILDHCNDVLAWNPLGHKLVGLQTSFEHPQQKHCRPNLIKMFFLEPDGHDLYVDAAQIAKDMVAFLRFSSSNNPDDPNMTALVGELCQKSDEFAKLWAKHLVQDCGFGVKRFQHPLVGRIDVAYEVLSMSDSTHRVGIYHAEPGTPAADALELLARS
ncbi:helix-turn-helix transcriptional regulator [Luteipulveratus mongoliensis]|uniref:XRE family transcriptional regulator n=1 Tax=Luteipulveratus mongoliensis TaxID=571913 RepID=A0A0K1JPG6_9MICO|nr:helix-turn-helix transcriptional regulator [Luteipulveratus mongoliensis]AKU18609.1 XRE family transcriptional regulator [Luteipulveratus mongoliensis]